MPAFFLNFAYTYGVCGLAQSHNDQKENYLAEYSHRVIPLLSGLLAVLVGLDLMKVSSTSKLLRRRAVWWFCVLTYYGVAITGAIRNIDVFGVYDLRTLVSVCGLLFLYMAYIMLTLSSRRGNRFHFLIKASSIFLFIIGFIYDSVFFPKCASYNAYQDCFEECPFPTSTNHKMNLNLAVMVATVCWTWSENSCPSIRRRKQPSNNDGDTVACDDSSVDSFLEGTARDDEPALESIVAIDPESGSLNETNECPSPPSVESMANDAEFGSPDNIDECLSLPHLESIAIDTELGLPDETNECPSFREEEGSNTTHPVVDCTPCQK